MRRAYYDLLDMLPSGATYEQVRKRYRELAKKHHPDKGGDPDDFVALEEAWRQIRPFLRKETRKMEVDVNKILLVEVEGDNRLLRRWVDFKDKGNMQNSLKDWVLYYRDGDVIRIDRRELNKSEGVRLPSEVERVISLADAFIVTHAQYLDITFGVDRVRSPWIVSTNKSEVKNAKD